MRHIPVLLLLGVALLSGCGGGGSSGDSNPPPATVVTGVVMAPAGQVAALQQRTVMQALLELVVGRSQAATLGNAVVPNALVELIMVDDNGNQSGGVYASVTTDANGRYALQLPGTVSMKPSLMLRVSGSGEILRAPVVQEVVDITPESEWLVRRLVAAQNTGGPTLSVMGRGLVLFLHAVVDSMAINSGADLAGTYANLDAMQPVFDGQFAAFTSGADQSGIPGTWHLRGNTLYSGWLAEPSWGTEPFVGSMLNTLSHYTVTLTSLGGNLYQASLSGDDSETSLYAHGGNCNVQTTQPYVTCTTMTASGFNGNADEVLYETRTIPSASQPLRVTSVPGRVILTHPAQLNIDGMFAEFTPTRNETYLGMAQGAFAGVIAWPSFQFAAAGDVVNYAAPRGGAIDLKPSVLMRNGSGLSNSTLSGSYGVVAFTHQLADDGDRSVQLVRGSVTAGGGAFTGGSLEQLAIVRTANDSATVGVATATVLPSAVVGGSYAVASNGSIANLAVDTAGSIPLSTMTGNLSLDGNFFYAAAAAVDASSVSQTSMFALKLFAGTPVLGQVDVNGTPENRRYRFQLGNVRYGDGAGNPAMLRLERLSYGNIEFDDVAKKAYVRFVASAAERAGDLSSLVVDSDLGTFTSAMTLDYVANANGTVDLTAGDGTVMRAYVSANGNRFLLTLVGNDFAANPFNGSQLGIGFANCGNCP